MLKGRGQILYRALGREKICGDAAGGCATGERVPADSDVMAMGWMQKASKIGRWAEGGSFGNAKVNP